MRKVLIFLFVILCLPAFAQDAFNKTNWKPFIGNAPIEFSRNVTSTYTFYKDTRKKFVNSFEGFVRYKVDNEYVYQLFVINCEQHTVSMWTQDLQHIRSEYLNPAHPVWWYRNTVCKNG